MLRGNDDENFVPVGVGFMLSGYCAEIGARSVVVYMALCAFAWEAEQNHDQLTKSYRAEGFIAVGEKLCAIARAAGVSERDVKRILKDLCARGWITTRKKSRELVFILGKYITTNHDDGKMGRVKWYYANDLIDQMVSPWRAAQSIGARVASMRENSHTRQFRREI